MNSRTLILIFFTILVCLECRSFIRKQKKLKSYFRFSETRIKYQESQLNSSTPYQILSWDAKVDNFNYNNKDTFKQRILFSDVHYKEGGPIFFYTGNEGGIIGIWKTSNYVTDYLAPQYGALLIFVEHRYFGESFPYNLTFSNNPGQNRYLSSEQALFDYARYLQEFQQNNTRYQNAKIVAFGTSYGGMLAAWARIKYPHVYVGAVANSAPLLLFDGPRSIQYRYFEMITKAFERYSPITVNFIRKANNIIDQIKANLTEENLELLNNNLNACYPIKTVADVNLYQMLYAQNFESAQSNYPPSYPTEQLCKVIQSEIENSGELDTDEKILNLFGNLNKIQTLNQGNCLENTGPTYSPDTITLSAWWYMTCTEMVFPQATNGVTDMFGNIPWNLQLYKDQCVEYWNSDIRPQQEFNYYGGRYYLKDFNSTSNIIFTNGDYDPWNGGCVQEAPNDKITVTFSISAHGEALWVLPEQNPTVWAVRQQIQESLNKWLDIQN